jgi:PEP-CTERM/exosortase A-associated glycosyltransferase
VKILHVLDHSAPLHSGYAFRTLAILREQRKLGWSTAHVTSPKHGVSAGACESAAGFTFHRSQLPTGFVAGLPVLSDFFCVRLHRQAIDALVSSFKPDVVHAHSPVLNLIAAHPVCVRHGIPLVYEMRSLWEDSAVEKGQGRIGSVKYRLSQRLETHGLRHYCDQVIVISDGLRGEIHARGIENDKITQVANGVDLARFPLDAARDREIEQVLSLQNKAVIGYAGSLHPYEGLDLLLRAFADVISRRPDARLVILGSGADQQRLAALRLELGLEASVHLVGQVEHQEIGRYLSLMSALVYPRRSSRLTELVTPLKPLEAMAQGIPVIASDIGGHRELITDRATGLMFEAGSVSSLVQAIDALLDDDELKNRLARQARHFVEQHRTWTATVANTRHAYARAGVRSTELDHAMPDDATLGRDET